MAAIPKELVESELFGHEKGAFTGAQNRKAGKFEQAEGGTLFLDEIGDMPADAQTKLLRVLQQGEFTPVGSNKSIKANVRIICATHRSLDEMIQEGKFREDLYYRLNVVPLRVPALRERRDDIAELTQHFLQKAVEQGLPQKAMTEEAITALKRYDWPGNIRELENLIYRICALYTESLINEHVIANELSNQELQEEETAEESVNLQMMLKRHLENYFHQCGAEDASSSAGLYSDVIKLVERPLIETTLVMTRGNQLKASKILGLNRNTLRKKMHDLSIGSKQSKLVAQAGK
jgi:two-component system nitrogen regulation response regulator GlnG